MAWPLKSLHSWLRRLLGLFSGQDLFGDKSARRHRQKMRCTEAHEYKGRVLLGQGGHLVYTYFASCQRLSLEKSMSVPDTCVCAVPGCMPSSKRGSGPGVPCCSDLCNNARHHTSRPECQQQLAQGRGV